MAWYNTYRPATFDDVIGQELVKEVLQNALAKDKVKHAYLFSGSKGIGKTTIARIFANSLNNISNQPENSIDIIELDAASNTGIDDIRSLIESAKIPPLNSPYKVFIIDEVHMLSKSAMNALLKILEEPPVYIIFLLATTNPEKLIPTVLSRLTKFNLSAHSINDIVGRLKYIAKQEGVTIDDSSLEIIAKRSGGSQRDAINMLETLSTYELDSYTSAETARLLGLVTEDIFQLMLSKIATSSIDTNLIETVQTTGLDGNTILVQLLEYLLDQSFAGNTQFDGYISPISTILSQNLPLASPTHTLSLLMVHLKPVQNVVVQHIPTTTPSAPIPQPVLEKSQPSKPLEVSQESKKKVVKQMFEEPKEQIVEPKIAIEELASPQNFKQKPFEESTHFVLTTLQQEAKNSSAPPIFKMILPDLNVDSVTTDTVIFSVTNGIFLAQLQAAKLQEWVRNTTGFSGSIQVVQRVAQLEPLMEFEEPEPQITEPKVPPNLPEKVEKKEVETTKQPEQPPKKKPLGKIFYKIYRELPSEAAKSGIAIYPEPIPEPPTNAQQQEDWDSHVEDFFEFE
jgi:DNA polymerase III subunit gamma/tau